MRRRLLFLTVWLLGVAGLWRWLPPAPRIAWRLPDTAGDVRVTPDGIAVVTGERAYSTIFSSSRGPLEAWDIAAGRRLWTEYGPDDELTVTLTGDGTRVRSWQRPDTWVVRVAATGERVPPDDGEFKGRRVIFRGDRTAIVATDSRGRFDLYELASGRRLGAMPANGGVAVGRSYGKFGGDDGVEFSADGRRAVMAVREPQELHVYDLETAALVARLPRGDDETPWGLLAGGEAIEANRSIRLTRTGQSVLALTDDSDYFVLPADDRWVVVSHDGRDCAWLRWHDALTGREDVTRRFTLSTEHAYTQARCPKPAGDRLNKPCRQGGRWLWCKAEWRRPASAVGRLLGRLPGLDFLADDALVGRAWLLDGSTGAVEVELSGGGIEFLQATDDGTLYVRNGGWVQVWDSRRRPSLRLFAALAAGWAGMLAMAAWLGRSARHRAAHLVEASGGRKPSVSTSGKGDVAV